MSDYEKNQNSTNENPSQAGGRETGHQDAKAPGKRNGEYNGSGPEGKDSNGSAKPDDGASPFADSAFKPRKKTRDDFYPKGEHEYGKETGRYHYRQADGSSYLRVVRREFEFDDGTKGKYFPQYHHVNNDGYNSDDDINWERGEPKGPKIPYNLPELLEAAPDALIWIPEGEKDADTAFDLIFAETGYVSGSKHAATCNNGGAAYIGKDGKMKGWDKALNPHFAGHPVMLCEDNDRYGARHVQIIARELKGIATSIRVIRFREFGPGFDLTDFAELRRKEGKSDVEIREEVLARAEDYVDFDDPDTDDFTRDTKILQAIKELHLKTECLEDKRSREHKALKDEAIELFAKLSNDRRGDRKELAFFRAQWDITAAALNEALKGHDKQRRKERTDKTGLHYTEKGVLFPNLHNACQLMLADEKMRDVFRYNQMTLEIDVMRQIPGEGKRGEYPHKVGDVDVSDAMIWLQKHEMFMVTETTTRAAVQNIAFDHPYHPVRDYLASQRWDGVPRIDTWLIEYGGAKDNKYVRQISAMFLIQMVARVMQPGCKADYILFLVGPQGLLKSSAAEILSRGHFSDDLPDIRDKRKASLHLCGLWVAELSELSSMSRAEVEDWKAFAARKVDKYQKPYGHYETTQPRQCVFIGTTNDDKPLKDKTGNRRSWIVEVKKFNIDKLRADRDQLFAEAYARYQKGEHWWPDEKIEARDFAPEQESFVAEENWEILVTELMQEFANADKKVGIKLKDMTQYMEDEFPKIPAKAWKLHLSKLGWEYKSKRPKIGEQSYNPIWIWSRKEAKHIERLQRWNSASHGEPGHWCGDTVEGRV